MPSAASSMQSNATTTTTTSSTSMVAAAAAAISPANSSTTSGSSGSTNNTATLTANTPAPVIRKRKVKFSVHLSIQELLSVPYLNGVLFCKVRLCEGGYHVSYTSKKEVANACVSWTDDPPIRFDVKLTQLVAVGGSGAEVVVGYEPCMCRLSVRKEQRGGRSYQKLGYVDHNLSDFLVADTTSGGDKVADNSVHRVLKEYESTSSKNQTRLDNSSLRVKLKVSPAIAPDSASFPSSALLSSSNTPSTGLPPSPPPPLPVITTTSATPTIPAFSASAAIHSSFRRLPKFFKSLKETRTSSSAAVAAAVAATPTTTLPQQRASSNTLQQPVTMVHSSSTNLKATLSDPQLAAAAVGASTATLRHNGSTTISSMMMKASQSNSSLHQQQPLVKINVNNSKNGEQHGSFYPGHSRTSSSGSQQVTTATATTTADSITTTHHRPIPSLSSSSYSAIAQQPLSVVVSGAGHNRSCSNGSIKSNTSYEFLTRTRNKKFIEDIQASSSSISTTTQQMPLVMLNHSPSSTTSVSSSSKIAASNLVIEPPTNTAANLRIIETRFDPNDVIAQIECELAAKKAAASSTNGGGSGNSVLTID